MLILLGNPGSANDLIAKAFSLSESVHHFKGAECDKVQSVARSAKLFMDDLPAEGTISVEAALGMLKQKQTKFYCGAGFKLEPEWTNNLFYTHNEHLKPLNSIRKLVAGNFGVNTYRNHKHTDIWPQHFDFWKTSIDKIHSIIENSLDHEGKPTDFSKRYVFAEYGNFHWFSQAFPDADLIFPKWRNQMHFAHFYHLRQYGHARDTDNLNNRDVDSHSTVNVGFAQELIKRFKEVTDTQLEETLLRSILFKFPHYIPQYLMIHHQTNVDELLKDPKRLHQLVRTALRRSMFFAMRKENMMRNDTKSKYTTIDIEDFFTDESYRQTVFAQFDLQYPEMQKYIQSVQSVLLHHKPQRADLPQEWKDLHNPPVNDQSLLEATIQIFEDYCGIQVEPTTALDDIKLHAPGKKQHWTTADELVIELTLVLRGIFNNIDQTNIGPWTDIYTVAEFVKRLEEHAKTMD